MTNTRGGGSDIKPTRGNLVLLAGYIPWGVLLCFYVVKYGLPFSWLSMTGLLSLAWFQLMFWLIVPNSGQAKNLGACPTDLHSTIGD